MARVERILTAYPRNGEELVGEWRLAGLELNELQAMSTGQLTIPMYDEYEVKPQHAERLGRAIGQQLDLARFEYFVGAVSVKGFVICD
jgi:hypothetical protein